MKVVVKSNLAETIKSLEDAGENMNNMFPKKVFRVLSLLEAAMKNNIRTDLNVRSGTLLNSVQKDIKVSGNTIIGTVGPEGNVPYAAAQNYGHVYPERFVAPQRKLALKWSSGGKTFFSKGHTIPSFEIKGVFYVENAVEQVSSKIDKELTDMIEKTIKGNS